MATDLRKAAILLMSLPEDQAAQLMSRLEPKQVEAVCIEIAKLGHLGTAEQDQVIHEFADVNPAAVGTHAGGLDLAKTLVQKALGPNAGQTLENVTQSISALPFGFLKKADPQNILTFIIDEHPQTIALIVSYLPPSFAAEIVKGLNSERQLQVIRRIAHMGQTNPDVIKEVERGLESRMANLMNQSYSKAGGVESVAEILNVSERATERALLEGMAEDDPQLVEEIRRLMFVFDDIAKLSDKDIQAVLKNVETNQWALALKGASPDLKQKILGNLSSRAAAMLKEEMDFLGPVRSSEVEKVQQQIVDIVRSLEDSGQITVHVSEEAEEFVQ
jgi:flagellar motor switch protein FliG